MPEQRKVTFRPLGTWECESGPEMLMVALAERMGADITKNARVFMALPDDDGDNGGYVTAEMSFSGKTPDIGIICGGLSRESSSGWVIKYIPKDAMPQWRKTYRIPPLEEIAGDEVNSVMGIFVLAQWRENTYRPVVGISFRNSIKLSPPMDWGPVPNVTVGKMRGEMRHGN